MEFTGATTFRTFASQRPADVGPSSDSSREAGLKSNRGTESASGRETGGSTAVPVSGKGDQVGNSEEGGAPEKSLDPSKGTKPLDAADKSQ